MFCGKLLSIVVLVIIKMVLYILVTVAISILKAFFQRLLGHTLAYPTPNFANFFSSPEGTGHRSTARNSKHKLLFLHVLGEKSP